MTLPELRGIAFLYVVLFAGIVIVLLYAAMFFGLMLLLPLLA